MGSRSSQATQGEAVPLLEGHLVETIEATWAQQTPENVHIRWCWNKVAQGEGRCQMCVVICHNPRKAAATLSHELFLGWAGTWPQPRGTGSSRVHQAFLGAAGIQPLLGETHTQRGGTGQSRSPSEVGGQGKWLHLRQASGGGAAGGLVTGGRKLKTEDGCMIADLGEQTG